MLPYKRSTSYKMRFWSLRLIGLCLLLLLATFITLEPAATVSTTNPQLAVEAQKLMSEAETLRAKWTEADLRKALQNYDNAAATWTLVPDFANASAATLQAGDVCLLLSEFEEALKRYARVATLTSDRFAQGKALSKMGRVYSYMGQNDLARSELTRALNLLKVAENDPNLDAKSAYGEALTNMAEVTSSIGYYPKVLDQLDEARRFLDHDREAQARIHLLRANTVGSLGDPERALTESERALELYRAVNNKDGEARARLPRALFYAAIGQADKGIPLLLKTIDIFRSIGDRHGQAMAVTTLGQAYDKMYEREVALSNYEAGLHLFESVGALDYVAVMNFKMAAMHLADNPDKALEYYDRCLTLSRAAGKLRNEANALSEIALAYVSQKRPDQAAKQHRKAESFFAKIGDRRGQAVARNVYSKYLLLNPELSQRALDIATQALPLSEQIGDVSILLDTLYNLASAHNALGNQKTALSFIERALKLIEDLRAGVGTPDLRTLYFSGVQEHYELCVNILMQLERKRPNEGFAKRAFLMSEKSRARSLVDLVRESSSTWREGVSADLLRRERESIALFQTLSEYHWNLSLSGKQDSTEASEVADRIARASADYHQVQAELSEQRKRQPALVEFELKSIEQVQQVLPADTMLLEFALGKQQSYLWAITSNSFERYELAPRKDLEDAAKEFYQLLTARQQLAADSDYQAKVEQADSQYFAKAANLSQKLLGPVAEQLEKRRLLIVGDGAIQLTPFEALPQPRSQAAGPGESSTADLLIKTNEIVSLPSMSTLLAMRGTKSRRALSGRIVAILADPVFSPTDDRVKSGSSTTAHAASSSESQSQIAKESLPAASRLVHASAEADAITSAAPYWSTMVAKGFDATRETAMSQRVSEYQIVHFATHGFLDTEHPELSAMVLSTVDQNGAPQNGFMPLNDIYNLDLAAELTVLSACQTALGKDVKGEGLVGLTHSFMSAGSKSVVASLWKVDDRATAALMSYFYDAMLQQGLPPAAALRAAKLKMMQDKQWSAPYYWAGFVFQGDYESRINVESNSRVFAGVAVLLLVLISSGLIVFLRRRRRLSPAERN